MAEVGASFGKPFDLQVAALRLRLATQVGTAAWDDLVKAQHDRAFVVTGAMKADLLADLEEFRRDFRALVERHGWHGWTGEGSARGEAWRTKVIYRTNMATSYAAGRWAQLMSMPYLIYHHGNAREPRPEHLAWDGLVLPRDHPFWLTHAPVNDWGCTCDLSGARSPEAARRRGGDPDKALPAGWDAIDPRTGAPKGIGKGWDYAPGASVAEELAGIIEKKLPSLPAPIGAAMFASIPRSNLDEITHQFDSFVKTALSSRVERNFMVVGALKPEWVAEASKRGVNIASAEIAVTDLNVQHTFRGTEHVTAATTKPRARKPKHDPLDLDWYRDLPRHLRTPKAVILDQTGPEPTILLIYDVPGKTAKLVIEIDTLVKKSGGTLNTVQTGRLINVADLKAVLGQKAEVIDGEI